MYGDEPIIFDGWVGSKLRSTTWTIPTVDLACCTTENRPDERKSTAGIKAAVAVIITLWHLIGYELHRNSRETSIKSVFMGTKQTERHAPMGEVRSHPPVGSGAQQKVPELLT